MPQPAVGEAGSERLHPLCISRRAGLGGAWLTGVALGCVSGAGLAELPGFDTANVPLEEVSSSESRQQF